MLRAMIAAVAVLGGTPAWAGTITAVAGGTSAVLSGTAIAFAEVVDPGAPLGPGLGLAIDPSGPTTTYTVTATLTNSSATDSIPHILAYLTTPGGVGTTPGVLDPGALAPTSDTFAYVLTGTPTPPEFYDFAGGAIAPGATATVAFAFDVTSGGTQMVVAFDRRGSGLTLAGTAPEPATVVLALLGLPGLALAAARRPQRATNSITLPVPSSIAK